MKKILFTPIGGTDPVSNDKDGSFIHICRVYQPDKIYMFLSKEMYENHVKDNRYLYCLEELSKIINHQFDVEVIYDEELVEVQKYDNFYFVFKKYLDQIREKMDDSDEIYLNVASGTPAMKSALLILSAYSSYRMHVIQVSTPLRKINPHAEVSDHNYDVKLYWEYNEDNIPDFENRCEEIRSLNLDKLIKFDLIKKHLLAYDYNAAFSTIETMEDLTGTSIYNILKMAKYRSVLNIREARLISRDEKFDLFPIKDDKYTRIFEYTMVTWLKLMRQEYSDFIRSLTPLIVNIYELLLKSICNINIADITYEKNIRGEKTQHWDEQKITNNYPKIKDILDKIFSNGFNYNNIVYSKPLAEIICDYSNNEKLINNIKKMTDVEQNIRNLVAHNIVYMSDELIKDKAGINSKEIFKIIKCLLMECRITIKTTDWNTYDEMNENIIKIIDNI